jgi:hypothetical protein
VKRSVIRCWRCRAARSDDVRPAGADASDTVYGWAGRPGASGQLWSRAGLYLEVRRNFPAPMMRATTGSFTVGRRLASYDAIR